MFNLFFVFNSRACLINVQLWFNISNILNRLTFWQLYKIAEVRNIKLNLIILYTHGVLRRIILWARTSPIHQIYTSIFCRFGCSSKLILLAFQQPNQTPEPEQLKTYPSQGLRGPLHRLWESRLQQTASIKITLQQITWASFRLHFKTYAIHGRPSIVLSWPI